MTKLIRDRPVLISRQVLRIYLWFFGIAWGLSALHFCPTLLGALHGQFADHKDFIQEDYLSALAARNGLNPYESLDLLAGRLLPSAADHVFVHPNPHSPFNILLGWPFTFASPDKAAAYWSLIEISTLIFGLIFSINAIFKEQRLILTILATLAALTTPQFAAEVLFGQTGTCSFLLLAVAYLCLSRRNEFGMGIALGLGIALKLLGVLFLADCLIRRRFRPVIAALFAFATINLIADLIIRPGIVFQYYLNIAPQAGANYLAFVANQSIFSIGHRLFVGAESMPTTEFGTTHLIINPIVASMPQLAPIVSGLALIAFGLWLIHKARGCQESEQRFLVLLMGNLVLLPVSWTHYQITALLALLYLLKRDYLPGYSIPIIVALCFLVFAFGHLPAQVAGDFLPDNSSILLILRLNSLLFSILMISALSSRPSTKCAGEVGY